MIHEVIDKLYALRLRGGWRSGMSGHTLPEGNKRESVARASLTRQVRRHKEKEREN
jgi:hypothetical protein